MTVKRSKFRSKFDFLCISIEITIYSLFLSKAQRCAKRPNEALALAGALLRNSSYSSAIADALAYKALASE